MIGAPRPGRVVGSRRPVINSGESPCVAASPLPSPASPASWSRWSCPCSPLRRSRRTRPTRATRPAGHTTRWCSRIATTLCSSPVESPRAGRHSAREAADVHLGIRDSSGRYIRGRVNLGPLSAGWHSWTWSGYKNCGTPAPDGHYNVTVHATFKESGFTTQDGTGAFVHRRYHPGSVSSTYSTIYPRATTLHDSTTLGSVRPRWSRRPCGSGTPPARSCSRGRTRCSTPTCG